MMERFLWVVSLSLPLVFVIIGVISRKADIAVPLIAAVPVVYSVLLLWIGLLQVTFWISVSLLFLTLLIEYACVAFWRSKKKIFVGFLWRTLISIAAVGGVTCLAMYFVALAKEGF
jgi:hypothetical protein